MERTICLDFGNTRLKCAVFNTELEEVVVFDGEVTAQLKALIEKYKPAKSILSSVVNHDPEIETLLAASTRFHKLGASSRLPVTIPVGKPETVGADRLAMIAAATYRFPNQHNLIIGLGSCITYNFVNKLHQFLGGAISPGMEMRFKSMNDYTALLPLIKGESNFPLVGYDTKTNLLCGVVLGMAKEIDGMIDEYSQRYSNFNVLLTGGDMPFFVPHLKNKIFADPYLIFKGLYAISEYNNR